MLLQAVLVISTESKHYELMACFSPLYS